MESINSYLTKSFLEENFIKKYDPILTEYFSKKGNVVISFYGGDPVDIEIDDESVEQGDTFSDSDSIDLLHNGDYITGISKDLINKINSIVL